MRILGDLRMLLLGLASTTALLGQVNAREIIRNAVAADAHNWRTARNSLRIEQSVHYSRYSSVAADARTIYPAEGRDALSARLNQFAKAIYP